MRRRITTGFTLIELLVVIAIIALLVSMLVPSLQMAKELARRVVCLTNQRPVATANHMYTNDWFGWYIPNRAYNHLHGNQELNVHFRAIWAQPWGNSIELYDEYLAGHDNVFNALYPCPGGQEFFANWWDVAHENKTGTYLAIGNPGPMNPGWFNLDWSLLRTDDPGAPADKLAISDALEGDHWWWQTNHHPNGFWSNHLVPGGDNDPAGANRVFCDGSGSWKNFTEMTGVPIPVGMSSTAYTLYWD